MSDHAANRRQDLQSSASDQVPPGKDLEPTIEQMPVGHPTVPCMESPFPDQKDRLVLKEAEAAYLLNLKVGTLRRWRWSGHGPPFCKLHGAVRYRQSDLEAYIEAQIRHSTSDTGQPA